MKIEKEISISLRKLILIFNIIICYHTQPLFSSIAPSGAVILFVMSKTMSRKGSGLGVA